ncbi:MAG: hypothetical protein JWN07_1928 [Hyphomicrobiales bacterium]|nr:hypothetical protein [Hyphomicrobiales bacterium]
MRRLATLSALGAGALALLIGFYVTHPSATGVAHAKGGFAPNSLLSETSLKTESWDAF